MPTLTKRQKEIYDYVKKYIDKKGYSPTFEEVKKHFKLSALSGVHQHIDALIKKGFLVKNSNLSRGIEIKDTFQDFVILPLLGTIAAGQPIEAIEERETIAIPKYKIPYQASLFALRVEGNSMIDDNIDDGDIVVVKKQSYADNGQRIVALINNEEVTLKKIYKEKKGYRLQPANSMIEPILIKSNNLEIQGVVIDIIKKNIAPTELKLPNIKTQEKENKNIKNSTFLNNNFKLNNIYNIDCFEFMKNIKNNTIDLIFVDPPYNLSKSNFKIKFIKSGGKDLNTNKGRWDNFKTEDFEVFTNKWISECFRILKDSGSIWVAGTYHNIYLTGYLMQKMGFETLNEILWHKTDATPNLSCTRFVADHENFIWARKKGKKNIFNYDTMKKINGGKQMRSIWPKGKTTGGKKVHPTQKPEWLLERIILAASNKKGIIFDPFMGSGTTAVMAKKLSRQFIGSEIDKDYYQESQKRLKKILV